MMPTGWKERLEDRIFKMVNGTPGAYLNKGASYDTDAWATPTEKYEELNDEFHFTLDVCANDQNHKCAKYFTVEMDGLRQDWYHDICFMNPPYSEMEFWLWKAYHESLRGATVVCLVKADTSTDWWHDYYPLAVRWPNECRFLKRIQFIPPPGYVGSVDPRTGKIRGNPTSPNMGSALLIFRPGI
jgi:site-specific DNA-methyltransferase (adenine-specific)